MTFLEGGDRNLVRLIVNRLAGVVPVASVFTVDPTNLERCTDGDWATPTGTGNKNVAAWTQAGVLTFDLGAIYNVELRGKVLLGNNSAASNCLLLVAASEDDVTYYRCLGMQNATRIYIANNTETVFWNQIMRGRYLHLELHSQDLAGTQYLAVYEVQAIDLGL